jgi:hypothetical protein
MSKELYETNRIGSFPITFCYELTFQPPFWILQRMGEKYVIIFRWNEPNCIAEKQISNPDKHKRRYQWPHGLRRGSEARRLLGLRVRIPPGAWMPIYCEWCVVRQRYLCRLFTGPEES